MADEPRSRLGRGLAALIGDQPDVAATPEKSKGQKKVPTEFIKPNPRNPRKVFDEDYLQELTDSIRERAISSP